MIMHQQKNPRGPKANWYPKKPQAKSCRGRRKLPEKLPWIAKLMPVARCNVRLYRNMLATDLLQLIVALVILQQVTQNNKLLKTKPYIPQRKPLPSRVHGPLCSRARLPPRYSLLAQKALPRCPGRRAPAELLTAGRLSRTSSNYC